METAEPWEHPDWYDLHDTNWTAGPAREPEHYWETLIALPPLDQEDHLIDVGAGTGKLAALIAQHYPHLGAVTLLEPNRPKLERAEARLRQVVPQAAVNPIRLGLGEGGNLPKNQATMATIGSVLMPIMTLRGGTLAEGLAWLRAALQEVAEMLQPDGWVYDLETMAAPWDQGGLTAAVRRLTLAELTAEFHRAGFESVECVYRFRDRVVIKAKK